MDNFHLADALESVFEMFSRANKYIDETMPWALAKDETKKARLNDVLYNLADALDIVPEELIKTSVFPDEVIGK